MWAILNPITEKFIGENPLKFNRKRSGINQVTNTKNI